jgi:hypothetical protein
LDDLSKLFDEFNMDDPTKVWDLFCSIICKISMLTYLDIEFTFQAANLVLVIARTVQESIMTMLFALCVRIESLVQTLSFERQTRD